LYVAVVVTTADQPSDGGCYKKNHSGVAVAPTKRNWGAGDLAREWFEPMLARTNAIPSALNQKREGFA
jgi:hypothetical protein